MKNKKEKAISLRLSTELHEKYTQEAIKRSVEEGKLINVSEIMREVLKNGLDE